MLNRIIALSLKNRLWVLLIASLVVCYGAWVAAGHRVDVLPDLDRPTVTILTEVPGLAPEEVESGVSRPIESALMGVSGLRTVRSTSRLGVCVVQAEFDWGEDLEQARRRVAEKLEAARDRLGGLRPEMAPPSSVMGEIMLVGVTGESLRAVRSHVDQSIRPRLLSIPGISQIPVLGGAPEQLAVETNPGRLMARDVTLDELADAVRRAHVTAGGGIVVEGTREHVVRILGRAWTVEDVADTVVREGIRVRDVADVRLSGGEPIGDASFGGGRGVILAVHKEPKADTLTLSAGVDAALSEFDVPGIHVDSRLFRQERFIRASVDNVQQALIEGIVLVVIVLVLFLWDLRTSLINLAAIPISLLVTALVFEAFGLSINTMTLGGIAVAVGELVDDSIVDVENIFRRLRRRTESEPPVLVVFRASSEIRNSIVYATLVIVLVMLPLLALPGIEGRLFTPIALAYMTALAASLLVSLTVTPVLASLLLPGSPAVQRRSDPPVLAAVKRIHGRFLGRALDRPGFVLGGAGLAVALGIWGYAQLGGEFLPPFNEGTLTVNLAAEPGTSLEESSRLGEQAEKLIREVPGVRSTSRRTGRADGGEHVLGSNASEIDVQLEPAGRPAAEIKADVRERLAWLPGVQASIGQPISHRIDHLLSGAQEEVAVKIHGDDPAALRTAARRIRDAVSKVRGVTDLRMDEPVPIPQVRIVLDSRALLAWSMTPADLAATLETALQGRNVGQITLAKRPMAVVVRFKPASRNRIDRFGEILVATPSGARVPLGSLARIDRASGPDAIRRENGRRRVILSCNVQGRDLDAVVPEIQAAAAAVTRPGNIDLSFGGRYEARASAVGTIYGLFAIVLVVIGVLLYRALGSWRAALQCMVNLPLAFVGGVLALYLFGDGMLSIASLIGFITLAGIAMRNGIMMISHYHHLMRSEGVPFGKEMVLRGSLERLAPVLMTAVTAVIALIPLAVGGGETGKEILHPLAIVVIGGLITSTLLDQLVTPILFLKLGGPSRRVHPGRDEHAPPQDLIDSVGGRNENA